MKTKYHDPINCVMEYQTRKLHYNDLIWRSVPKRKREKREDTFTGPHRVLKQLGRFSYETTSHLQRATTLKLNINDMKQLHIPDTFQWVLNEKYFEEAVHELQTTVIYRNILIDFRAVGALISDVLEGKQLNIQFFVIPDWPCMEWYATLHEKVLAEAVKLSR